MTGGTISQLTLGAFEGSVVRGSLTPHNEWTKGLPRQACRRLGGDLRSARSETCAERCPNFTFLLTDVAQTARISIIMPAVLLSWIRYLM